MTNKLQLVLLNVLIRSIFEHLSITGYSLSTRLRCNEIFNDHFITQWLLSMSLWVKKWKSVNICRRYGQLNTGSFFLRNTVKRANVKIPRPLNLHGKYYLNLYIGDSTKFSALVRRRFKLDRTQENRRALGKAILPRRAKQLAALEIWLSRSWIQARTNQLEVLLCRAYIRGVPYRQQYGPTPQTTNNTSCYGLESAKRSLELCITRRDRSIPVKHYWTI